MLGMVIAMFGARTRSDEDNLVDRLVAVEHVVGNNIPRLSVCENNLSELFAKQMKVWQSDC